jgi:hypothetical protein
MLAGRSPDRCSLFKPLALSTSFDIPTRRATMASTSEGDTAPTQDLHVLWIPDFDGSNIQLHIDTEAAQEHHNLGDEGWHADLEAFFEPLDDAIDNIAIELWDHDCEAFLNRGRLDDHIFDLIVAARTTLRNARDRERRIVEMLIMHHGGTWSTVSLANWTDEENEEGEEGEDAAAPSTTDVRALTISGDGVRRVLGNLESMVERGRREQAEVEKRTEGWTIYQHFDNDSPGWGDSSIADLVRTLHLAASTCTTSPTFRSTLSAELKSSRKSSWYQDLIDVVEGRGQGLDIVDCFKGVSETTQTDDGSSACGLSWYWTRAYTVGKDGERAETLASTLEACVQIAMDAAEAAGEHHETDPPWYPEDLGSEHDFDFDR